MKATITKRRFQMNSAGLIFSGESIRAMLAGTKTRTSRLRGLVAVNAEPEKWGLWDYEYKEDRLFVKFYGTTQGTKMNTLSIKCPWQVGDKFYIKETWKPTRSAGLINCSYIRYKADDFRWEVPHTLKGFAEDSWRSPMFMPQIVARPELSDLTITGIGCERVGDISERDCVAEGWPKYRELFPSINTGDKTRLWFRRTWNSLHASPKAVRANSEWARILRELAWENERDLSWGMDLEPGSKEIVGYVSFPFSKEDGDHRKEIRRKPHSRCMNPFIWVFKWG